MVTIRLSRSGAKKKPFYHLVVTDSRNISSGWDFLIQWEKNLQKI